MNKPHIPAPQWQLDKQRIRDNFSHAATTYDDAAVLQREVADRLMERLDVIRHTPGVIADVGAGTGYATRRLAQRFPKATMLAVDLALPMLQRAKRFSTRWRRWRGADQFVCGDAERLPFADASVDFIFSSLTLQWCQNLDQTFAECRRILRPGGLFLFATLGPDTLKELRVSWRAVDGQEHVNAFIDMHDIGDALLRARFADPVMDVERLTMTYRNAFDLMHDLKRLGAHNALTARNHQLTGKQRMAAVVRAYEAFRRDGVLPATHEVVYGHAWRGEDKAAASKAGGEVRIPLSSLKR